jgi:hypothetical protein
MPFLFSHLDCPLQNLTTTHSNELIFNWTLSTCDDSNDLFCPFITPRHGWRRKHNLSIVEKALFTYPLPTNRCPIVARVGSRCNVYTESLPSNGSIRHSIISQLICIVLCRTDLFMVRSQIERLSPKFQTDYTWLAYLIHLQLKCPIKVVQVCWKWRQWCQAPVYTSVSFMGRLKSLGIWAESIFVNVPRTLATQLQLFRLSAW